MSSYYIHRVGSQEMGSVEKNNGTPQRGRYFLISKECLSFFPHLSSVALNDKAPIFIVPMYGKPVKVLCTIDYHNQKHSLFDYIGSNPRDEVRLYMNKQIDPNLYFKTGDFAVFEKFEINEEIIYSLTRIESTQKSYDYLEQYLSEKARKPYYSNVIYDGELEFIEKPNIDENTEISISSDAEKYVEDASGDILSHGDDCTLIIEQQMGGNLFNSVMFRQFVLHAYDYQCAITRKAIKFNNLCNLEAAHIKPQAHNGTFLPCNGIAMSRDLHFAFDKGFFTIDHNYKVRVAAQLIGSEFYKDYNGLSIFVPKVDFYRPNKQFLYYHRDHIFQTFAQIKHI